MSITNKILLEANGVPNSVLSTLNVLRDKILHNKYEIMEKGEYSELVKINDNSPDFTVSHVLLKAQSESKEVSELLVGASYSGLEEDKILISVNFVFPKNFGFNNASNARVFREYVESVLIHELTHAYEDNKLKSKGKLGILSARNTPQSIVSGQMSSYMVSVFNDFLYYIYLSSPSEINAKVTEIFPLIKNIKDPYERIKKIKSSDAWIYSQTLKNYNFNDFNESLRELYEREKNSLDDNPSFEKFVNDNIKGITSALNEEIDYLIDSIRIDGLNDVDDEYTEEQLKVFQDLKNNNNKLFKEKSPIQFIKYWIRAFNFSGNKLENKLKKLAIRLN